jgi:hypothetical protein
MTHAFFTLLFLAAVLLSGCRSPNQQPGRGSAWEHDGVAYPTSAEYLDALARDRFFRTFPPDARLPDFRSYEDMHLGLYYFHYIQNRLPERPALSTTSARELRQAMQERGITDAWFTMIQAGRLQQGMPLTALYASWGPPWNGYRTETREGQVIQHIYLGETSERIHVFTTNGVITSWKD